MGLYHVRHRAYDPGGGGDQAVGSVEGSAAVRVALGPAGLPPADPKPRWTGLDARGNLRDDGARIYQYDALNRLVAVHRRVGSPDEPGTAGGILARYGYDGSGRRTSAQYDTNLDGVLDDDDRADLYAYDAAWRVSAVARREKVGGVPATYLRERWYYHEAGLNPDAPMAREVFSPAGALIDEQHFLVNRRGDVVAVVGPAYEDTSESPPRMVSGAVRARVSYWAYGQPRIAHPADFTRDGVVDEDDADGYLDLWTRAMAEEFTDDPAWGRLADFDADGSHTMFDLGAFDAAYDDATLPDDSGLTGHDRLIVALGNLPLYAGYWWDGVLAEVSWRAIAADHADPGVGGVGGVGGPSHADLGLTDRTSLGLYHVRHRAYDPGGGGGGGGVGAGRWLQRDPIGTAGGPNLYQYADADPLRLIDPMGLRAVEYLGTDCDGNELTRDRRDEVTPEEWAQLARDSGARNANGLGDFLAGIADEVTFGGTRALRGLILGEDDGVDAQSGAYRAGEITAVIGSLPYRGVASAGRVAGRHARGLFAVADDAVRQAASAVRPSVIAGRTAVESAQGAARASAHGVHVSIGGAGGVSRGIVTGASATAGAGGAAAAKACGGAKSAVQFNKHHTVPKEVLKALPDVVANNPLVRGRFGAPNRWRIPEGLHKQIHKGAGGGAYNKEFKRRLLDVGGKPTVDDVLRIRNELVKEFGLEGYRP
ncbi:MAG: RHS repeat-associated core domain-containing protein [Phycisphaeraceae bacterium]|nr:MAG: RHS repeat-associated core domain-containing protein [Phycisphaeraceae bacterium]